MRFKTVIVAFIFLSAFQNLKAQTGKHFEIELKPILGNNGKYFYDSKQINFDGLMFPMLLLNDSAINRQIRTVQLMRSVKSVVRVSSMLYIFLVLPNQTSTRQFEMSRNIILGMLAFGGGLVLAERFIKKRVVARYNSLVLSPNAFVIPGGKAGVGIVLRF
jgi:hypothetical protein